MERKDRTFDTWDNCMRAGYKDSMEVIQQSGDAYLNANKTYIKFICTNRPVENPYPAEGTGVEYIIAGLFIIKYIN